jgi:hypothetical protein
MADVSNIEQAIFETDKHITVPQAEALLKQLGYKVSKVTIRTWIGRYKIGIKRGGRFLVDPDKLTLLLKGALRNRREYC